MATMLQRATLSDYDVEADWLLFFTCNYRCAYCFIPPPFLGQKLKIHGSPEEWGDAFDATGKRWLIHMTGGEPTLYPGFASLCERLTQRNVISFNSNLSRASVREIADRVDPSRVSFINAGFHEAERARRGDTKVFLEHARFLQDAGFRVIVTAVATSEIIANLPALQAELEARGLHLVPKILRNVSRGDIQYPAGYTQAEKAILRDTTARARGHYRTKYQGWPTPSINIFADDEFLDGIPDFRGRLCAAGERFVSITPEGDVHRCDWEQPLLGNLLARTLALASGPSVCDTGWCPYFCKKYAAEAVIQTHAAPGTGSYPGISF